MSKKYQIRFILNIVLILILFTPVFSFAKSNIQVVHEMLAEYFDLIRSGNYESALGMWDPLAVKKANRLGIDYNDIPLKIDCNSPVLYNYEKLKNRLDLGIKSKSTLDTGFIRIQFKPETINESNSYLYYAKQTGNYFWFIFPQDYYSIDWPIYESKYFRFIVNPLRDNSYNKIASTSLDLFVEEIAAKISISPEELEVLAREKIDYYLCQTEQEVFRISGHQTDGFYDPASDAIISSNFPEFHLVARLLVNYKLNQLPLFTLPVIKEGLAISLGGRWYRSPGVILDFGEYILNYDLTEIDSVLTAIGNENINMSDITFPIEACMIDYIINSLGTEKFFQLYNTLSGDVHFVNNLSINDVKNIIGEAFEQPWNEFKKQFDTYTASEKSHKGLISPGQIKTDNEIFNDGGFVVSSSEQWLKINYTAKNDQNNEANLVFSRPASLNEKTSELFKEQYKENQEYKGYRFGIRIDKNEIGLYDYAINQLKAKYIYNFSPDPAYYDSTNGVISAYFDINLLEGILPGDSDYELIK
ncbi:MAG: hypothetical protein GY865_11405 [candidate division Zixibacteria bacterium]|nr:hypothetical protein [candidate division Zixibacteria bacterium]